MAPSARWRRRRAVGRVRAWLDVRRRRLLRQNVSFGGGIIFYDALPMIDAQGEISIGNAVSVYSEPVRSQITAAAGARIGIGDITGFNFGVDIYASTSIEIGPRTMVGPMVVIHDTNFHPIGQGDKTRSAPIKIGADVWLGRGAIILPGVEIGDFSVVGAGSVVTRDVPPRTLVAGMPAKPVREINAPEGWSRRADPG